MLTDNRADIRTQDWFLIACDGDLVLKLAQDLMIGEDERGQTVLSPAREDALLRITSDHGCLTLQAMAMDWTFSEDGGLGLQHLTFVEGLTLKLSFPNSSLLLTPDFRAGSRAVVDREIRLRPTDTPTLTLTRLDEPLILIEPDMLPAPDQDDTSMANASLMDLSMAAEDPLEEAAVQAEAAEAFTRWDHQIPDEQLIVPEARPDTSQEALPEAPREAPPERLTPAPVRAPRRQRHRLLTGLIAALALIAPMYLFLVDASGLGVSFSLTHYRPLSEIEQAPAQPAQVPAPDEPVQRLQQQPPAGAPIPVEPPGATEPAEEAPARDEEERLLIASLLAEAKAYYQAGSIVTPVHTNAVSNLTQVLSMDPSNEEGLRLMYMSAVALIEEAEAAHEAGDDYLARNLVEDVLGFHPEFDDARALLDSWTRVPEG